ncbi:MAG: helicase HerA-like domain-containing protein [Saprospiraceae bacterium]
MSDIKTFTDKVIAGNTFKGDSIIFGVGMLDKAAVPGAMVKIPLSTLSRHGLIAGATGSGKTKSLQILAEQISLLGVPSLLMDIKGDLSGIAAPGSMNPKIEDRCKMIGIDFVPHGSNIELMSLSKEPGIRLRATITEFGPVLFCKMLDLNDVQSGVVSIIFKYCDDNSYPLIDLDDFKEVLQYVANEGKSDMERQYGLISTSTVGSIMRKIVELETQGAETFFGEPSFEVADLCRLDQNGYGMISVIRLTDIQDRPKLFSTFMLQLLAEIYASFPEEGDVTQPKLCLFIDEAHLIFSNASKALLEQIEAIIKLIRSKGIGVFFITQNPTDIPESVLSQLGLKIQHALRAFTANDRKDIKLAAQNFPISEFYEVDQVITELGTGEAFVTALNEKGIPTPLVHTLVRPPLSRMDILSPDEISAILGRSKLSYKYSAQLDRQSAKEIIQAKLALAREEAQVQKMDAQVEKGRKSTEKGFVESFLNNSTARQIGRTLAREISRGLLGVLGIGGRKR